MRVCVCVCVRACVRVKFFNLCHKSQNVLLVTTAMRPNAFACNATGLYARGSAVSLRLISQIYKSAAQEHETVGVLALHESSVVRITPTSITVEYSNWFENAWPPCQEPEQSIIYTL